MWRRSLRLLWALPWTLVGLSALPLAYVRSGAGGVRRVDGALEIWGPAVAGLLRVVGLGIGGAAAFTLGHVIWGCDRVTLDRFRVHERVHVRQYERFGPLFPVLYLSSTYDAWVMGRDPYRNNRFEEEACEAEGKLRPAGPMLLATEEALGPLQEPEST